MSATKYAHEKRAHAMTRRRFLRKGALAGLTAAAAPMVLRSGVLAANGNPGANDRLALGLIGAGTMGPGLARIMSLEDDVAIAAVADVDLEKAEAVAGEHGADAHQDYRQMLDRDDIEAVIIATPEHWHGLPAIHAAQAGKDIYCEKPVSLTIREGRLMAEAVRKYERVFQTGSQDRSREANRKGCMLVRNGRIGAIKRVIAYNHASPEYNGLPGEPVPDFLDWDMWCGPVQPHPFHPQFRQVRGWVTFRDFGGHSMTSNGAHGMDQIQWALGMDEGGPVEVWTEGEPYDPPTRREPGLEQALPVQQRPNVFMRYPGDIVMELGDAPMWGGRFIGEEGELTIARGELRSDPPELAEEPLEDPEIEVEHSEHHYRNWLDCIKTREDPIAHVEVGHRSATVCHLANIARWVSEVTGETGEHLEWDPEKEEFTNSQWGNHFLDRPRRKAYDFPERI
ncbi:MAG: Gfo/Idh/MocA family protein [Candidatus Hydrogenedentota bacterium]